MYKLEIEMDSYTYAQLNEKDQNLIPEEITIFFFRFSELSRCFPSHY